MIILVAYKYTKKPFGWAIQQVMGSLIQTANVQMRKTAGEIFDAAPTICAMGRSAEFEVITNNEFYLTSLNITMALGGLGSSSSNLGVSSPANIAGSAATDGVEHSIGSGGVRPGKLDPLTKSSS